MPTLNAPNRWFIAAMGVLLQLCLGTVYAWSCFQLPLVNAYHWSNTAVAWAFSLAICCLGLAAAWGGLQLPRHGPRRLAMAGGILFGAGYLLAALALHLRSLPLLYLGYGVVGGCGLGLGYVTPVATAARWFPDRKGLVTGLVIMGFGLGALLMSKVLAPLLVAWADGNYVRVFAALGLVLGVLATAAAACLRNPPPDWVPPAPPRPAGAPAPAPAAPAPAVAVSLGALLRSRTFLLIWLMFFCNIVAGIALISFQSPLFQDLQRRLTPELDAVTLASYGATLVAVSSLFNGIGRLFWGGVSDRVGRLPAFRLLLGTQVLVFAALLFTTRPLLAAALICYVLLCYGGGFGTLPAFVLDTFGSSRMPVIYGTLLTAWSAAGIVGPQLVAWCKDHCGPLAASRAFAAGLAFLVAGFALSLLLPHRQSR